MIKALWAIILIINIANCIAVVTLLLVSIKTAQVQQNINTAMRLIVAALHDRVCDLEARLVSQGKGQ